MTPAQIYIDLADQVRVARAHLLDLLVALDTRASTREPGPDKDTLCDIADELECVILTLDGRPLDPMLPERAAYYDACYGSGPDGASLLR